MDSSKPEVATEFPGIIRVYKDGHVERLIEAEFVPPPTHPKTGVSSKDIIIIPESNVSARLFLPKPTYPNQKLPLLVYFNRGAFCVSSPFTPKYSNYLNALVAEANVIAVSVNYRKAPEHPIPTAYEDSWAKRAATWDSFGAPIFLGSEPIGSEALNQDGKAVLDRLWPFLCPANPDNNDPRVNPISTDGPSLVGLGCRRVLVCVAEKDVLRDRGWRYYEALGRSGWMGVVEIMETDGEGHGFHLNDLDCEKAKGLITRLAAFYNRDMTSNF
ncbi:hypothetical protein Godav_013455 [Gossypium davidsonii]|uniref:Alpha/beta hydrolase fold-3 domain-containing protein n=1 Tax=Gossypium davidsonii TaxID=34287 RepID=A0A7J8RGE1_GOSDV|nr:hypothetical protein [Gossypium davidsonii]